ncbi:hypothetical protein AB7C87_13885 [Natrarchaeobius sp. A-rgal3]|uniref:hypothetical protein n=1 Tax=Natrarchaeobius versutus TaxID=1679078 RepID=UPI00350EECAC
MSSVDWPALQDLSYDLVDVDLPGLPGAVAWDEAGRQTRDAITATLLEDSR